MMMIMVAAIEGFPEMITSKLRSETVDLGEEGYLSRHRSFSVKFL